MSMSSVVGQPPPAVGLARVLPKTSSHAETYAQPAENLAINLTIAAPPAKNFTAQIAIQSDMSNQFAWAAPAVVLRATLRAAALRQDAPPLAVGQLPPQIVLKHANQVVNLRRTIAIPPLEFILSAPIAANQLSLKKS